MFLFNFFVGFKESVFPHFIEDLTRLSARSDVYIEFSLAMFFVIFECSNILCSVIGCEQSALAVAHVFAPGPCVAITSLVKMIALPIALALFPFANVKLIIVIETFADTVPFVGLPYPAVFIPHC